MASNSIHLNVSQSGAKPTAAAIAGIGKSASAAASALRTMRQFLVVASFVRAAQGIFQLADRMDDLQDKIDYATKSGRKFEHSLTVINQIAREVREPIEAVGEAYAVFARAGARAGLSQDIVTKAVTNFIKAVKVAGGDVQAASDQIGRFFSRLETGTLQQKQINTLLQETPAVLDAVARGYGKTATEFSAMVKDNPKLLTTSKILTILATGSQSLSAAWANQSATFGEAFSVVGNAFKIWLAEFTKASGVTQIFMNIADALANNMDTIMRVAIIGVALALEFLVAKVIQATAQFAIMVARNPFIAIAAAIAVAVNALVVFGDKVKITTDGSVGGLAFLQAAWDAISTAISYAATVVGHFFSTVANSAPGAAEGLTGVGYAVKLVLDFLEELYDEASVILSQLNVWFWKLAAAAEAVANWMDRVFGDGTKQSASAANSLAEAVKGLEENIADLNTKSQAMNHLMNEGAKIQQKMNNATAKTAAEAAMAAENVGGLGDVTRSTARYMDDGASSAKNFASSLSNVATQAGLAANGMAKLGQQTFQGGSYTGGSVNLQQASAGGGFSGSGFSSGISQQGVGNNGLVGTGSGFGLGSMSSSGTMSFSSNAGVQMRDMQQQLIAFYKSIGDDSMAWRISKKSTDWFGGPGFENPINEWTALMEEMNKKMAKMEMAAQKQLAVDTIAKEGVLTLVDRVTYGGNNISDFYGREQDIVYQSQLQSMIAQGRLLPGQGGASGNVGQAGWGRPFAGSGSHPWMPALGMASGGAFQMPGNFGGKDSLLAALRLAPGEEVHVRRPKDKRGKENGGFGQPASYNITFNVQTPDADSFRHNQAQMGQSLLTAIRRAERQRGVR